MNKNTLLLDLILIAIAIYVFAQLLGQIVRAFLIGA